MAAFRCVWCHVLRNWHCRMFRRHTEVVLRPANCRSDRDRGRRDPGCDRNLVFPVLEVSSRGHRRSSIGHWRTFRDLASSHLYGADFTRARHGTLDTVTNRLDWFYPDGARQRPSWPGGRETAIGNIRVRLHRISREDMAFCSRVVLNLSAYTYGVPHFA